MTRMSVSAATSHPQGSSGRGRPQITAADQVLRTGAERPEWLAARRTGLGGSDALACMGLHPYRSALELYLDKIGFLGEPPVNRHMEWGSRLEDAIAAWFTAETGERTFRTGTWRSRTHPWMLANPDRLLPGRRILEIKTCDARAAKQWASGVPSYYEAQVLHYLLVTGFPSAVIAVLVGGNDPKIHHVDLADYSAETVRDLIAYEEQFWHDHVLAGRAPAADDSESAAAALAAMFAEADEEPVELDPAEVVDLLAERRAAKAAAKEDQRRARAVDNRFRELLGEHAYGTVAGRRVVTLKAPKPSLYVPAGALEQSYPDIHAELAVPKSTSRTFRDCDLDLGEIAGMERGAA